jgi:hypothetical protein
LGWAALTPGEKRFLETPAPAQQDIVNHAWRYEALAVLHWALGVADDLPFPSRICDVPQVARTALDNNRPEFIQTAALRPVAEVLEALDLHFRLHWAARQAGLDRRQPPAGLDAGVIQERHHALNWLSRFEDNDWDDVDTPPDRSVGPVSERPKEKRPLQPRGTTTRNPLENSR